MSRIIRTLIVDDEPLARRGLELRLAEQPDIQIVAQCGDGARSGRPHRRGIRNPARRAFAR